MHVLDLLMYIVLSILYWIICPKGYKYDLGIIAGVYYFIIFTFVYAIIFIFFLNWIDIFHHIHYVTIPSITW